LHIRIYIESGNLVIENNLQKKASLNNRKGVGLQNIVNRYGILTKRVVTIEETSEHFRVRLAILTKQTELMETQECNPENAYLKAKKRGNDLKDVYGQLTAYCIVIPFLIFINLYTYDQFQWFWFPMLGWGMGLAFHAFEVFGYGKKWEERKIKELMEKENKDRKKW